MLVSVLFNSLYLHFHTYSLSHTHTHTHTPHHTSYSLIPRRTCLSLGGSGLVQSFRLGGTDVAWVGITKAGHFAAHTTSSDSMLYGNDVMRVYNLERHALLHHFCLINTEVEEAEAAAEKDNSPEVPVVRVCGSYLTGAGMLVTAHVDGSVCMWNLDSRERVAECALPKMVSVFASNHDATVLYLPAYSSCVVWNTEEAVEKGKLQGHKAAITRVVLSKDDSLVATCAEVSGEKTNPVLLANPV